MAGAMSEPGHESKNPGGGRDVAGSGAPTSVRVRLAIRGDRESLSWVVTRLSPLLRAQASFRLGPRLRGRVDPEDVVSEAWLVAIRRLGDFVHDGDGRATPRLVAFLGTTVLRIVNRRIDEAVRQTRRMATAPGEKMPVPVSELEATVTGAVTNAARSELAAALERCLADLPERDQEVIILRLVEGVSNDEVARELGEAANTVSHRYRRALAKLREAMPESFLEELEE
jgi:RNA polymerase sigma-70 factor (ECF subfamily)